MQAVSVADAIRDRRSVRGYLDKPVPQDVLNSVFELARWAPSGTNIQPWQVYVASGDLRDTLREQFMQLASGGEKARPDYNGKGRLGEPWKERRRDCARVLYEAMDVDWDDMEGRGRTAFRNFEMFDAPHVAFLCINEVFGMASAADVGMYTQTLMLSMHAHGLASCAQGTMAHYPEVVREAFGLEPEVKLLYGLSFGYEDPDIPANTARTDRATLEESVVFRDS